MRLTWGMMVNNMLAGMNSSAAALVKYQSQLATGKRINKPSDDPTGVVRVLSLRATLNQIEGHLGNISQGQEWLSVTETGIARAGDIMANAIECAQRGATDALSPNDRAALAAEVVELIDSLLATANAKHVDRYVFAGTRNREQPFSLQGSPPAAVDFHGNAAAMIWEIEPGVQQQMNVRGEEAFAPAFTALFELRDNLLAGDVSAISGQCLGDLQAAHESLLVVRTDIGAKSRRLDESQMALTQLRYTVFEHLDTYESADMAEAIMRLQLAEASYSAAQAATARIIRPTLVDLLK